VGKSGVLEHKRGNRPISDTRKDRGKWRTYRNSPKLFRTVPPTTPYGLLFPKIGGWQPPPKTSIAIIPGTSKTTDFKFGRYIHRVHPNVGVYPRTAQSFFSAPPLLSREPVKLYGLQIWPVYIHSAPILHPNKSPFKILEKREREHIQGLPSVFKHPLLSQERVKLRTSIFSYAHS